ncbi:hypothetical protein JCM10212_001018 [Sporobolomyces blumeae]
MATAAVTANDQPHRSTAAVDPRSSLSTSASSFAAYRTLVSAEVAALVSTCSKRRDLQQPVERDELDDAVKDLIERAGGWTPRAELDDKDKWKADTRRVVVEKALDEQVQAAAVFPADERQQRHLEDVLDVVLIFVERGYIDETVPLTTLASLMELRPISACEPLLGYIESRVERLTKGMEYQRGRGPILLRLLNDLLRRLPRSQAAPVILSGRILMLLSSVYPLGEKSGVNLRGNFNIGKGTVWDAEPDAKKEGGEGKGEETDKMEVEEGEEEEAKDAINASSSEFYATFWSLQRFFNNPHLLFTSTSADPKPLTDLHSALTSTLSVFAAETKKEKELSGSSGTDALSGSSAKKGKAVDASGAATFNGEKDDADKTEESLEQYFFPKFLTSRNLLALELSDPTFRLQLILQALILIQYLLSLTPTSRARAQTLPITNQSAFPSFVLSDDDEKRVRQVEDKCWKEIENMQGGSQVRRAVETVLERERNWTDWKLRSCEPFTKPGLALAAVSESASQRLQSLTRKPPRFPHRLGNPRLSRIWSKDLKTLEGFEPDVADDEFDSIVREWRMTKKRREMTAAQIKQLPSGNARIAQLESSLEPMEIKLQALQFRALRAASTQYLRFFKEIGSGDIDQLLELIEKERRKEEEEEEKREQAEVEAELRKVDQDEDQVEDKAVSLGDTPKPEENAEVEDEQIAVEEPVGEEEAGTPPPPASIATTPASAAAPQDVPEPPGPAAAEPGTPKRPREDEDDVEMQDGKKPKLDEE